MIYLVFEFLRGNGSSCITTGDSIMMRYISGLWDKHQNNFEYQRIDTYTVQKLYALSIHCWRFEQPQAPEWVSVALEFLLTMQKHCTGHYY